MRKRTWQPAKPKQVVTSPIPDEVREHVDARATAIVADLKQRFCQEPKTKTFNWPEDVFARWHRNAVYIVAVMRTPHGRPPTFESHVAKMEYAGDGKFNLAVPMRRGWNTFMRAKSADECLNEIQRSIHV